MIAGEAYLDAPRRRQIILRGEFDISPSTVERVQIGDSVVGYVTLPRVPYIEVIVSTINTGKLPKEFRSIVVRLCNGKTYAMQAPTLRTELFDRRGALLRFEGTHCQEIKI
jgi:hypothetical protein